MSQQDFPVDEAVQAPVRAPRLASVAPVTATARPADVPGAGDARSGAYLERMLHALNDLQEAILQAEGPIQLYAKVCDTVVSRGRFMFAGIVRPVPEHGWTVEVSLHRDPAQATRAREALEQALRVNEGLTGLAVRTRRAMISNDFDRDPRLAHVREAGRAFGVAAAAVFPLVAGGEVPAALLMYSDERGAFSVELVAWLERLVGHVAHALTRFEREADRSRAEHALRASEDRLRKLVELAADWYWEQDADHRLVRLEGRNREDGLSPAAALLGKCPWEFPGIVSELADFARLRDALARREAFRGLVYAFRDGSGRLRYVSVTGEPLFDRAGVFIGYRGVSNGVTRRRRAEALTALEHAVTRSLAVAESSRKVLQAVMREICEAEHWETAGYFRIENEAGASRLIVGWVASNARSGVSDYYHASLDSIVPAGGLVSRVARTGEPIWIADLAAQQTTWQQRLSKARQRASFLFPVRVEGRVIGVVGFASPEVREPDEALLRTVAVIGEHVGQFIERKEAEQVLRESEARFRALTDLSSDWYWESDAEHRLARVEGRNIEGRERLLGRRRWETGLDIEFPGGWAAYRALLAEHRPFRDVVMVRERTDGSRRYISVTGEPFADAQGAFAGYRGVGRDVTDGKLAENRIRHLAMHDGLTGLPNRLKFGELLAGAIESAQRHDHALAVLFVDLDRFKLINDTLGHEAGDELLKAMARHLVESLRSSDVVARLGGDEFVVLVPNLADRDEAEAVAGKILAAATRPIFVAGQECRVTASVGISMFPADAEDERALMRNADIAMYLAKEAGKNSFAFYAKGGTAISSGRLAMENQLRGALERGEFDLHYQPKLDLRTDTILGAEALLRWHSPQYGTVSPAQFIPLAEETGLIVPIGRWVLHAACAQAMAWQHAGLPPVSIAVNLSARQFADPNLLEDIAQVLDQTGMPPARLELEITESMLVRDPERAIAMMAAIKDMSVRLAIDDFGTGYSSLGQLKRFPIDTLKIDRSFIRDIPGDAEDRAITEAILAMGRSLGLTVVAEGVETAEQQAFLAERGCDAMQGFHFSRPVPAEDFAALMRRHGEPVGRAG